MKNECSQLELLSMIEACSVLKENNYSHVLIESEVKVWVAQLCLTLCDPMDCSPSGSSVDNPVHGVLQKEYWSGLPWPSSADLPKPGIEPGSLALQTESLLSEPPGKPHVLITLVQSTFNQNGRLYSSGAAFTKPRNNNLFRLFFLCIFPATTHSWGKTFFPCGIFYTYCSRLAKRLYAFAWLRLGFGQSHVISECKKDKCELRARWLLAE